MRLWVVTMMRITDAKHTSRSKKSLPNPTWFRMVPLADARWAAQSNRQKRQTLKHPPMEPFGTESQKIAGCSPRITYSHRHTSTMAKHQDLCFCFATGRKEDHFYAVCKHTRDVKTTIAYRDACGHTGTNSIIVLATRYWPCYIWWLLQNIC